MKSVLLGLKDKAKHTHVHLMYLPGRLDEVKGGVDWLQQNDIQYIMRRIRPMTNKEGKFNPPGASGMKFEGFQFGGAEGYYNDAELEYLNSFTKAGTKRIIVNYLQRKKVG